MKILSANTFLFVYNFFILTGIRYIAESNFITAFNNKKSSIKSHLLYVGINFFIFALCYWLDILFIGEWVFPLIVLAFSLLVVRIPLQKSLLTMVITFSLTTFYSGFSTILLHFFSTTLQMPNLFFSTVFQATASSLLLFLLLQSYRFIIKYFNTLNTISGASVVGMILPSVLIIFSVNLLVRPFDQPSFSASDTSLDIFPYFVWLLVMLIAFISVLAASDRMAKIMIQNQEQNMLQRELRIQEQYIKESKNRWETTKEYQHDIRNHLLVVSGLLKKDKQKDAIGYLDNLVSTSNELVSRIISGSPAVDILLEEKIRFAEQENIAVSIDLRGTSLKGIQELDLCILFANAIDNAISASIHVKESDRFITVQVAKRHDFIIVEFKNRMHSSSAPLIYGIGLKNIEKITQKYDGSMAVQIENDIFTLKVLLISKNQL